MPGWTAASGPHCVKIGMSFARRVRPGGAMVGRLAGRYPGRVPCARMRGATRRSLHGRAPCALLRRAPPREPAGPEDNRRMSGAGRAGARRGAVRVPREVRAVLRVFCGGPPVAATPCHRTRRCDAIDPQVAQHLRRCATVANEIRGVILHATEDEGEGASLPFRSRACVPNLFETNPVAANSKNLVPNWSSTLSLENG